MRIKIFAVFLFALSCVFLRSATVEAKHHHHDKHKDESCGNDRSRNAVVEVGRNVRIIEIDGRRINPNDSSDQEFLPGNHVLLVDFTKDPNVYEERRGHRYKILYRSANPVELRFCAGPCKRYKIKGGMDSDSTFRVDMQEIIFPFNPVFLTARGPVEEVRLGFCPEHNCYDNCAQKYFRERRRHHDDYGDEDDDNYNRGRGYRYKERQDWQ